MGDSVTVGFGRRFAFATSFPVTLCSREMVSDVSVTYLSIPFTIRTQETVLSFRYRDVFDEGRPSHQRLGRFSRDVSSLRAKVCSRHDVFISSGPSSSSSVMKNCPFFQQSSNRRRSTVWSISVVQEVLGISARILATSFPVHPRQSEK